MERLFEKGDAVALHRVEPQRCRLDVLAKHLPGIDQQHSAGPETLARGVEMGDVALVIAERRPAELGGAESRLAILRGARKGLVRRRSE